MLQLIKALFQPRPVYFIDREAADALIAQMNDRKWADSQWDLAHAAAVWAKFPDAQQQQIFDDYDQLHAAGELIDPPFYAQWRDARGNPC